MQQQLIIIIIIDRRRGYTVSQLVEIITPSAPLSTMKLQLGACRFTFCCNCYCQRGSSPKLQHGFPSQLLSTCFQALGRKHLRTLGSAHNLSNILREQGQYQLAVKLLEETKASLEEAEREMLKGF